MKQTAMATALAVLLFPTLSVAESPSPTIDVRDLVDEHGVPTGSWPVPPIDRAAPYPTDMPRRPASVTASPPPPLNLYSDIEAPLSHRERANVALAREWIDGAGDYTGRGEGGAIVFRFGASLPTVVCAPMMVCDIELQPGEVVNRVDVGDTVRWSVTPAISGSGQTQTTHIVIKPFDTGLTTNLLVNTDRRTYRIKLVSRKDDFMPAIAFSYPQDEAAEWQAYRDRVVPSAPLAPAAAPVEALGNSPEALDFGFAISGDYPTWRPLRVYSDGVKTYIQFSPAAAHDESPALIILGPDKNEQLVNYRALGDRFVIDKVIDTALLVSGTGRKQTRVRIDRERGR